jgi:hypothetical protein
MDIDFNLDNYNLQDLLNLFKLNYNFNLTDLKNAKKIVLQVHPDKSGLDKEYFIFYCKAFRTIKQIYDVKHKKQETLTLNNSKIEYLAENEEDKRNRCLVENLLKKDNLDFNKWFNETFDKINIVDEERKTGYGHWFQTEDDIDTTSTTLNMLHQKIQEKKNTLSALVKKQDIEEINNIHNSKFHNLDGSAPESYGSNIFSKLPYEDLKKAHTETVVPVGDNDYKNIRKFNNVDNLRNYRNNQNLTPMSKSDTNNYYSNKTKIEEENHVKLAYKLTKQDEEMEKANDSWWKHLRLIK